jgi:hypothetical protein
MKNKIVGEKDCATVIGQSFEGRKVNKALLYDAPIYADIPYLNRSSFGSMLAKRSIVPGDTLDLVLVP